MIHYDMIYCRHQTLVRFASAFLLGAALVATTLPAHAEAGKGLSRITPGEILWGLFLFAVGVPLLLGLFVFALLILLPTRHKGNLTWCLSYPLLTWVLCLGLLLLDGEYRHVEGGLLLSAFVAVGAAVAGYYRDRSDLSAPEQREPEEPLT